MSFTPGTLSRDQAANLNQLEQAVKALLRMDATSPLGVRRFAGLQPLITLNLSALASQLNIGLGSGSGSEDLTTLQVLTNICLNPFTIPDMVGATSGADGEAGLAPKPVAGDEVKFLRGDGAYAIPSGGTGTVTSITVTTADGLRVNGSTSQTITASGTFPLTIADNSLPGQKIMNLTLDYGKLGQAPALSVVGNRLNFLADLDDIVATGSRKFLGTNAAGDALSFRSLEAADLPSGYNGVPPGVLCPWPTTASVPSGWVEVGIGGTASRTGAAGLYAAWGTDHGAGDGSTTFGLPDLRGRTLVGAGSGGSLTARTNLSTGGAETHTLSTSEMPAHTHSKALVFFNKSPSGGFNLSSVGGTNDTVETMTTDSTGGGGSHANMQPWYATRFITPMN